MLLLLFTTLCLASLGRACASPPDTGLRLLDVRTEGLGMPGSTSSTDFPGATWVSTQNFGYPDHAHGRKGHQPLAVVCHVADGPRFGVVDWFRRPESEASSNYLVCKDGEVVQFVRESDAAWTNEIQFDKGYASYASDRSVSWIDRCWNEKVDPNLLTITIEFEGDSGQVFPERQVATGIDLIQQIYARHGWSGSDPEHLVGHFQIDRVKKLSCPGPTFPWTRVRAELKDR